MKCLLKKLTPALGVCLVFGGAFAQESGESERGPIPGVEAAADYQPPPPGTLQEPAQPPEGAKMPWEVEAAKASDVPPPVPSPVADEAPITDAPLPSGKPPKAEKVKKAKEPRQPVDFNLDGLRAGAKGAFGFGGLSGHVPLNDRANDQYAIILKPFASAALGLSVSYSVIDFVDAVVEAQYSYYKARNEFVVDEDGQLFRDAFVAGAVLHAVEFPIFARVHAEQFVGLPLYAEAGLTFGGNVYSYLYDSQGILGKPIANYAAAGALLGVGYDIDDNLAAGLRGNYVFTRYAKNVHGRPWAVRADVTYYFLSF